jgi:hypothetical protein
MTVTLNYTVTGSSDFQQTPQSGQSGDVNSATITLFIWRQGDDLSCHGAFASHRMWAAKRNLVVGANQVISAPLIYNNWTNCYGQYDPTGFLSKCKTCLVLASLSAVRTSMATVSTIRVALDLSSKALQ